MRRTPGIGAGPRSRSLTLAEQSLFGIDIDPWAVDAAAYVLLYDVLARDIREALRRP